MIYDKLILERNQLRKNNKLLRQVAKEALYMRHGFPLGLTFNQWIRTGDYRRVWNRAKSDASTAI